MAKILPASWPEVLRTCKGNYQYNPSKDSSRSPGDTVSSVDQKIANRCLSPGRPCRSRPCRAPWAAQSPAGRPANGEGYGNCGIRYHMQDTGCWKFYPQSHRSTNRQSISHRQITIVRNRHWPGGLKEFFASQCPRDLLEKELTVAHIRGVENESSYLHLRAGQILYIFFFFLSDTDYRSKNKLTVTNTHGVKHEPCTAFSLMAI